MHVRVRLFALALFGMFIPFIAQGQDAAASPAPATVTAAGPTLEASATAVRSPAVTADSAGLAMLQRRQSAGKPVALMIVGGAAILVGAVIGDAPGTLFMVGGAVALLYGLYLYLQ